ncbi:MAG: hypothetical protein MHPSP_001352 [Paramarteilia canceri]
MSNFSLIKLEKDRSLERVSFNPFYEGVVEFLFDIDKEIYSHPKGEQLYLEEYNDLKNYYQSIKQDLSQPQFCCICEGIPALFKFEPCLHTGCELCVAELELRKDFRCPACMTSILSSSKCRQNKHELIKPYIDHDNGREVRIKKMRVLDAASTNIALCAVNHKRQPLTDTVKQSIIASCPVISDEIKAKVKDGNPTLLAAQIQGRLSKSTIIENSDQFGSVRTNLSKIEKYIDENVQPKSLTKQH